ncbi:MAG: acylphosphatase [Roseicyclus sp.]|nr:acylphosphatase [Roseicyclus sp.]
MPSEPTARIVTVMGRVQGVSYRAWARRHAEAHGLVGWVRNEADGSVSALVEGPPDAVEAMIDAMRSGPPAARVDRLTALPGAVTEAVAFEITG